jgi:hypothetical protein
MTQKKGFMENTGVSSYGNRAVTAGMVGGGTIDSLMVTGAGGPGTGGVRRKKIEESENDHADLSQRPPSRHKDPTLLTGKDFMESTFPKKQEGKRNRYGNLDDHGNTNK